MPDQPVIPATPDFDPDAVMDAMAPLLSIVLDPAYRPGVALNLTITAGLAAQVLGFPLGDHAEPAAIFHP